MNRLKLYILFFTLALAIPLGYFVVRSFTGMVQEEEAELRYFAEELFGRMEEELILFIEQEEGRSIDEYNYLSRSVNGISPLALAPEQSYVVGYFQNNPDGSIQTPLTPKGTPVHPAKAALMDRLKTLNAEFNAKRSAVTESPDFASPAELEASPPPEFRPPVFAERYLERSTRSTKRAPIVQEKSWEQELPKNATPPPAPRAELELGSLRIEQGADGLSYRFGAPDLPPVIEMDLPPDQPMQEGAHSAGNPNETKVEMDPMQSLPLGDGLIYLFRRIMVNNQIFRQGVVVDVQKLMEHLVLSRFSGQP
ncbi:MAG: hypothetical protein KKC99_05695, partial [Proteobacteria bacterium]|nr:hypothetical protein [Pseudomonadota bacterium]